MQLGKWSFFWEFRDDTRMARRVAVPNGGDQACKAQASYFSRKLCEPRKT